jgi:ATP-dependent Clp protease protease subunit
VHSIIEGSVASAATLISIVCKKRYMLPNAHMMIHQLSSEMFGKMNELTDEYTNLTDTMNLLKTIYMKYAGFSKKKLEKLLSHDLMLNSKKAMKYKLVDELYVNNLSVCKLSCEANEV